MAGFLPPRTPRGPNVFESLLGGLAEGVGPALQQYQEMQKQARQKKAAQSIFGQEKPDISQFPELHPDLQKIYATESLRGQKEKGKSFTEQILGKESYATVNKRFGKDTADLWKAATEGGKTKVIQHALENELRTGKVKNQFNEPEETSPESDEIKPEFKVIDYDRGLTPKERVARQNTRYEKALPLIQASQQKLHAYDTIGEEIGVLQELSPQIGGWERLNIDPHTGDLLIPALASPEAQQFVKTINDFTVQAKDSYGSRVTNFDLNQFMRRLPTLANSEEGRRRILEQMKIINDLNKMYEESVHNVFEEHGGIRNIDYDRAQEIAYKKFQKDSKPLKTQFREQASAQDREFKHVISEKKKKAPKGQVLMMTKEGQFGYVDETGVNEALKDGLTIP